MKTLIKLLLIFLYSQNAFANGQVTNEQVKISVIPEKIITAEFYEKHIAVGQSKLANSKDYFAKVSGKVDFVSPVQGNKISRDDILIIIDKDIAENLNAQAKANLYLAESNYNRDLSLLKKKIISEEGINKSKATLEEARNEYTKALNIYQDRIIKAIDNGYIGVIKANVQDEIKVGDYLFSLTTKSNFYVFVELPQILHDKISILDNINVYSLSGKLIAGKILAISDYVSNHGTITAKLEFPYSDDLLHGAYVETEIIFNKHKNLAIPEKAVMKNNQGNFVYSITPENKIKQLYVDLGVRTNNMIELLSDGLKEGDLIVVDGLTKVFEGAEVIINDALPDKTKISNTKTDATQKPL